MFAMALRIANDSGKKTVCERRLLVTVQHASVGNPKRKV
jgi:hypothetical protein